MQEPREPFASSVPSVGPLQGLDALRNGPVPARLLFFAAATSLIAGCSGTNDVLPQTWHSTDDSGIELALDDDGTGVATNFPVWKGTGSCVEDQFETLSGPIEWHEGRRGNPMIETEFGEVEIAPAAESFTINWDKLVIVLCEGDPRRLVLYTNEYGQN